MNESKNQRIHQYLDGDLKDISLNDQDVRVAEDHEAIAAETRKLHRSIKAPDLTANIMSRLPARPAEKMVRPAPFNRLRQIGVWLWLPRPVQLRPAYGIVAALTVVLMMLFLPVGSLPPEQSVQIAEGGRILVHR
jgi:hypothetical protein